MSTIAAEHTRWHNNAHVALLHGIWHLNYASSLRCRLTSLPPLFATSSLHCLLTFTFSLHCVLTLAPPHFVASSLRYHLTSLPSHFVALPPRFVASSRHCLLTSLPPHFTTSSRPLPPNFTTSFASLPPHVNVGAIRFATWYGNLDYVMTLAICRWRCKID